MPANPRAEQVLAAILETSEDAIVGIGLDGSIAIWSRGAEQLYGYTVAEVKGHSITHFVPLYEVPALDDMLLAARGGLLKSRETVERLTKQGSKISVAVRRALLTGERGEVAGILESGWRVQRTPAGMARDAQLRLLAEQMPAMLWATDQNLRITSHWGSGCDAAEPHSGEMVGRTVFEYLRCPDTNAAPMGHHYAALRGESVRFEHQREDRVLDIHIEPLRAPSGEIIGCVGVGLDITQRKKTEEQIR